MSIESVKLAQIRRECDKHILRMNSAYKKIAGIQPLNAEKYQALTEDEIVYLDQYLFRFAKLQDTIANDYLKSCSHYLKKTLKAWPLLTC